MAPVYRSRGRTRMPGGLAGASRLQVGHAASSFPWATTLREDNEMTLRKWITLASAAGLIAGVGACKENPNGPGNSSKSPSSTEPQGRRGDMPSRSPSSSPGTTGSSSSSTPSDTSGSSSGTSGSSSTPSSPSTTPSSPSDSSGSSSGSSSDTTKR